MALEWWNELAIRRVERGETRKLLLRDDESSTELAERVWRLDTLEELVLWGLEDFVLPPRLPLQGLRHLGWLVVDDTELPEWASGLTLDLHWRHWSVNRERFSAEQVTGLRIAGGEDVSGPWPTAPLTRLYVFGPNEDGDWARIEDAIESNAATLTDIELIECARWPEAVTRCARLQRLVVSDYTARTTLPDGLSELALLEELTCYYEALEELPASFDCWPRLRRLGVGGERLRALPQSLGELPALEELVVEGPPLRALPETLVGHQRIKAISLQHTELESIPDWLFRLPRLCVFNVGRYGSLGPPRRWTLPASLLDTGEMLHFRIGPQYVIDPPPEVVAQGLDAIKAHMRQSREQGQDFLTEAKLLIVGEAGAGKTTLALRLVDPDASMPAADASTEGIDVRRWPVDGLVGPHGRSEKRTIDVNIWDFGGQEIYHATHQFFLSRRAVYVLVADGRKEDTDFYDWLRRVAFFGHDSPVLIVLNERAGRRRQIDFGRLRAQFPALVDAVTADLSTPAGMEAVRAAIEKQIRGLPHLSERLPKSWRTVRDRLEELRREDRDYISQREYFDLCAEHGFTRVEDKRILSQFLHDIGVCLHFQRVPTLMETVILEPEWGTDAVYRVLDDESIIAARGRFTFAEVEALWSEARYDHKRGELLALMEQFELCYPLPDGRGRIAPQLLGVEQPAYRLPSGAALALRYRYDFMPKGIVSRFIVNTHNLIADQGHVWRHGVVLRRGEAWAEVIEDYPARQITVRVVGHDRRTLLGIIDWELERIHARFDRALRYDTLVSCPSAECVRSREPGEFTVKDLQRFADAGLRVRCHKCLQEADPRQLFDGVLLERAQRSAEALRREGAVDHSPERDVYVSYAWACKASQAIVDRLVERLRAEKIALRRDRDEVRYKQSFAPFMEKLGQGRCVVVVLSRLYFESMPCMSELLRLAEHPDFIERVFPVHAEAGLHVDELALDAEIHWHEEFTRFDDKLKKLSHREAAKHAGGLEQRALIRDRIGELHDILAKLNALPDVVHGTGELDGLMSALRERLAAAR